MIRFLLLLVSLLVSARGVWAQTDTPASFPRWYVGVQYGRHDYQLALSARSGPLYGGAARTNAYRPQLTLGYQVKPNLAVQAGLAPARQSFSYGGTGTNDAGQPLSEKGTSTTQSLALPLLVRYTIGLKPWKKLELDALAGTVLFWSRGESEFTRTENGEVTAHSQFRTTINNAFITVGPSARYAFGRHVEAYADWLFYKNLRTSSATYSGGSPTNNAGITNALNLGIRYRFGYR
jgi:hypothetical protein